jgi:hypothetical protein
MESIIKQIVIRDLLWKGWKSIVALTFLMKVNTIETDWDNNYLAKCLSVVSTINIGNTKIYQ